MHEAQLLGDRYRLVERLGEGGMSQVWRGHDEVLGRDVAVKVATPRFAEDKVLGSRLRVEAQAAARLCHPHITAVYDYGESTTPDGIIVPYVVMELVDGEPLAARLADGALSWQDAVVTCAQVAAALATAHANGIVHRDVTPANIMLTSGGAKVVDFGISALTGDRDVSPDGSLFGTPAYLAPERLDAGRVEPATDVYGLGLLLYKSLAGRLPWPVMTTTQMLKAHRYAEPAPLPTPVEAEVPPEVIEVCRSCLAKQPQERPASEEVAQRLAEAAHLIVPLPISLETPVARSDTALEETTRAWASPQPEHRRRRRAIIVLAGLVLTTLAVWAGVSTPVGGAAQNAWRNGSVNPGIGNAGIANNARAAVAPAPSRCRVDYQVREDSGSGFTAQLAVTNQGPAAVRDWRLVFAFASDQRIIGAQPASWDQSGRTVVTRPAGPGSRLDPGDTLRIALTGRYQLANPSPVAFDLDGSSCQTVVVGAVPAVANGTQAAAAQAGATPGDSTKDTTAATAKGKGKGTSKKGKSK